MNDQLIRDLLREVADDVEPGDRLDAIRAATAPSRRRTQRGWWTAGSVGLAAASVVTALALTTGGSPQPEPDGPAAPAPATASDDPACCEVMPVYFVGDTPAGPRLFRELQQSPAPGATFALGAALRGDARDPDYRSPWPAGAAVADYFVTGDLVTVSLEGDVRRRPAGMDEAGARLAVEQLVRTAQGVLGRGDVPVRLLVGGQPAGEVLGVPASSPLRAAPDLDVLAPVSLSEPDEGQVVDNDAELLHVRGRARSDGRLVIVVARVDGTGSLGEGTIKGGLLRPDRFTPFESGFTPSGADPGDYEVVASVRGADGTVHTDTRRITVVD